MSTLVLQFFTIKVRFSEVGINKLPSFMDTKNSVVKEKASTKT